MPFRWQEVAAITGRVASDRQNGGPVLPFELGRKDALKDGLKKVNLYL
jgi:hypothetical protein